LIIYAGENYNVYELMTTIQRGVRDNVPGE